MKRIPRQIPVELEGQIYLDPKYDPAFKELFDSEDALKDFLDAVLHLEGNDKIKTITFTFDKTINFRTPQRKKVILDIFATTGSGRFLDIEMQKAEHDYFINRTILYKAFLIIKGKQEMARSPEFKKLSRIERESRRYELPESIAIWLCDFDLPGCKYDENKKKDGDVQNPEGISSYIDEWFLCSRNSIAVGEPVSIFPKNKYIVISLPNFKKSAKEVQGSLDAWLYLLNHASDGTELPSFGNSAVEDALGRIRVDSAGEELLTAQVKDMVTKEENETRLASAILKGRSEGADSKNKELAKAFRDAGVSLEIVSSKTGLSLEEIKAL